MDGGTIFKLAHAILGITAFAVLIGRWMTLAQAARSSDIAGVRTLLSLSDRFEWLVIRIPPFVLLLGVATAIAQGRPFLGPLQGAPVDWLFAAIVIYLSPLPLVPLVFLPRGRVFAAALDDATSQGVVTPALTDAFRDRVVLGAHAYEVVSVLVVFGLMIAKPF